MSKKLIIVAIILIIVLSVGLINNKNKEEANEQLGKTTNLIATKKTNGTFEIYNTDIKIDSGTTKIKATIKNISGDKTEEQRLELELLDKAGNEIGRLLITVPTLENEKSTIISAERLTVYENVNDFRIK